MSVIHASLWFAICHIFVSIIIFTYPHFIKPDDIVNILFIERGKERCLFQIYIHFCKNNNRSFTVLTITYNKQQAYTMLIQHTKHIWIHLREFQIVTHGTTEMSMYFIIIGSCQTRQVLATKFKINQVLVK